MSPYGTWRSPITADLIVSRTVNPSGIVLDGEDVYWVEGRPSEGGRSVVVRRKADGGLVDVTPPGWNVRTRVHEYGGGEFAAAEGVVYFSNFIDQRLYRQEPGGEPRAITPDGPWRYADMLIDRPRRRLVCVREEHDVAAHVVVNTVVAIDSDGTGKVALLASGNDFYSSPRLSPDGSRLAWITWHHPNMPWDGSELWVGELDAGGAVRRAAIIAGGPDESIFQPEWSPDGELYFVSDRTGWWNLYHWNRGRAEPVCPMPAEFGVPQWVFGMSTYAFHTAQRIVCAVVEGGTWRLARLEAASGRLERIEAPYADVRQVRATAKHAVFCAGSPTQPMAVVELDAETGEARVLRRSNETAIDPAYISIPQLIEFPSTAGRTAFGFFYPPRNRDYIGPPDARPPLLVKSHGGPTAAASTSLNLVIQYWTSRGIAVLDVNYGGSTGYGRAYRQRLDGQWGIVDVDDCVNGARYLVAHGAVDGDRLAITGGSAGGYTTLAALTFRDIFKAGASHYGIADLEALAQDTHKFESRYLDRLVGPYPQQRDVYVQRSPINFPDRLSCPLILFQGLEDKVVPPNQAEVMAEALRAKGIPFAYVPFEGEGHGFRRAENIKRALDGEFYFYSRIFRFTPAEPLEPVRIENLP